MAYFPVRLSHRFPLYESQTAKARVVFLPKNPDSLVGQSLLLPRYPTLPIKFLTAPGKNCCTLGIVHIRTYLPPGIYYLYAYPLPILTEEWLQVIWDFSARQPKWPKMMLDLPM